MRFKGSNAVPKLVIAIGLSSRPYIRLNLKIALGVPAKWKKKDLVHVICVVREAWETVIAELGTGGLELPGAAGDWRVRDVLAIFNGWDRYNLVQLRCAFTGEIPTNAELTGGIPYPPRDLST